MSNIKESRVGKPVNWPVKYWQLAGQLTAYFLTKYLTKFYKPPFHPLAPNILFCSFLDRKIILCCFLTFLDGQFVLFLCSVWTYWTFFFTIFVRYWLVNWQNFIWPIKYPTLKQSTMWWQKINLIDSVPVRSAYQPGTGRWAEMKWKGRYGHDRQSEICWTVHEKLEWVLGGRCLHCAFEHRSCEKEVQECKVTRSLEFWKCTSFISEMSMGFPPPALEQEKDLALHSKKEVPQRLGPDGSRYTISTPTF